MAVEHLPLFPIPRVLVPGTVAGLPAAGVTLFPGEEVVAVFCPGGRPASAVRIAARATVKMVRTLGPRTSLVRLHGEALVRLLSGKGDEVGGTVPVTGIPEPGADSAARRVEAERALHRYLALRAESGEACGRLPCLSRDPVRASHEVASYLRVSWPEVQDILEAGSAADRLRRERTVLDKEAELLRRLLGREGV